MPIWMPVAAVVRSRSRSSSAAAAARAASSSWAMRRPEHAVQVGALVAEGQLEDVAAEASHDPLRAWTKVVELDDRVVIVVVVDAAEAQEERERRPELGQELAAPGSQALVDGRQQPRPDEVVREPRSGLGRRGVGHIDGQTRDDAERPAGVRIDPELGDPDPRSERSPGPSRRGRPRPCSAWCSASASWSMRRPASTSMSWIVGIADDEAPGRADRDGDLHRERERAAAGRHDRPDARRSSPASRAPRPSPGGRRRRRSSR